MEKINKAVVLRLMCKVYHEQRTRGESHEYSLDVAYDDVHFACVWPNGCHHDGWFTRLWVLSGGIAQAATHRWETIVVDTQPGDVSELHSARCHNCGRQFGYAGYDEEPKLCPECDDLNKQAERAVGWDWPNDAGDACNLYHAAR